jgi:hypothetical protein
MAKELRIRDLREIPPFPKKLGKDKKEPPN